MRGFTSEGYGDESVFATQKPIVSIEMSDTLRINNLFTTAIGYSTLTGSTITTNSLSLSTLTVSSINSGTPGVAAYSTLNVSTLNATSTITASTITTTSYVGIGTANPIAPLHVYNTQGISLANTTTVNYTQSTILGFNYGGGSTNGTRDSFRILSQAVNRDNGAGPNYDYGAQADLIFQRKTNNLYSGGANDITYTEVMRLGGATGYVGIGATNPMYKTQIVLGSNSDPGTSNIFALTTADSSASSQRLYMGLVDNGGSGSNSYSWISASRFGYAYNSLALQPVGGNVGIGATNPTAGLHIKNSTSAIRITGTTTNTSVRPALSTTPGSFEIRGSSGAGDGADDGFIRLSAGGGSGAAAQSYIDISGYSTVSDMYYTMIFGTAGTERMRINSNGFVGIGTNNPGYLLDVNGTLNIRGSFTVNGTAVATGTGSVWTVGASNAIYYSAGNTCLYRNRLIFSNAINDFNHCIYNNGFNVDSEGSWDGMKFNVYSGAWFRTGNVGATTSIFMNTSGYVGIGTTTVSFPLTVWTSGGAYSPGGNNPYIISPTISVQNTSGYGIVSGWFQKDVIAGGAVGTFSDLRIKNNVQPVTNALETIDRLNMVSHGYIDHIQNRQSCSFGLIAQQVKHIVPDAVLLTTDYIPNIMCTPLTAVVDGDHIMLTFDHPIDLAVNNLVRFILKDRQVEQTVSYVSQDQMVVHVSAWSNPNPTQDQIFVYGKQVDDFHILDKPKMGLLALAGVKELIKQNAEQAEKITTLESQLSTVLSRLNAAGIA